MSRTFTSLLEFQYTVKSFYPMEIKLICLVVDALIKKIAKTDWKKVLPKPRYVGLKFGYDFAFCRKSRSFVLFCLYV